MRRSSLMMHISPLLIFVYAYVGLSKAAPRIDSNDVSPVSGKRSSASDTWQIFRTDMPHSSPGRGVDLQPPARLKLQTSDPGGPNPPQPETLSAPAPRTGANAAPREQVSGHSSRLAHKRSTDAGTTLLSPDKAEQQPGMMFMVSQQTGGHAWAADNTEASFTAAESLQGGCLLSHRSHIEWPRLFLDKHHKNMQSQGRVDESAAPMFWFRRTQQQS